MENQESIESYQNLFDHMKSEYNLILTQPEMDEIIRISTAISKT